MSGNRLALPARSAASAAIVLLLFGGARAQDHPPLDVAALITLHEAGLSPEELARIIERHGLPALDADGLERLRAAGLPGNVLDGLAAQVRRDAAAPMTLADVLGLVEAGVPAAEIVARIEATDGRFDLTMDDLVTLVRRKVPAAVIKAMRGRSSAEAEVVREATTLTVEDVLDLTKASFAEDEIIRRIRSVDARFDALSLDRLLELHRQGVGQAVLKEIWSRRAGAPQTPDGADATASTSASPEKAAGEPATAADEPAPSLVTHREPSGAFSLLVPPTWVIYRDTRNRNSLVSFTDKEPSEGGGLADSELQVLRYRSRHPERLTETNLDAIGHQFLGMLRAATAKHGMQLSFDEGRRTWASGQTARSFRVSSTADDGRAQEGRVVVTWYEDQVFVLSYSVRADLLPTRGPLLDACVSSFTLERNRPLPEAPDDGDPADTLFSTWRTALERRDFALYRQVSLPGADTPARRAAFVTLARRLADPAWRLLAGPVAWAEDGRSGRMDCRLTSPSSNSTLVLSFERTENGLRLRDQEALPGT